MARTVTTLELPPVRESECPEHKFCAYTGKERGRCSFCHSTTHDTDDHGELPPGQKQPCLCAYCLELFTSISAFDQHQRPAGICRDPARRGLVQIEKEDRYGDIWTLWGKPGSRPEL